MIVNILLALIILVSVVLSAFFSGSEIAIASFNQIRFKNSAEEGNKKASLALKLSENFVKTISAILLGNNLVNIISSTAGAILFTNLFPEYGETIATAVITIVVLIFGEILPKILSADHADDISLFIAKPLFLFSKITSPIINGVSLLMEKLSPIWTPKEEIPAVTADELVTMVDEIMEEGVFTEEESELIKSAIEFSDVYARDIMIPRVDIYAFDIEDGMDKLIHDKDLMDFKIVPVYKDTLDNIIGTISTKKLVREYIQDNDITIEELLEEPFFVHMTRNISSILNEFKNNNSQMAIVLDEYGGTMGILTSEDIMEEIVGEIYDEDDEIETPEIEKISDDSYLVDGGMPIEELFEEIDYHSEDFESEYSTVGGFATEQLDKFPVEGDHFVYDYLDFTIVKSMRKRVELVMVKILPREDEEENKEDYFN